MSNYEYVQKAILSCKTFDQLMTCFSWSQDLKYKGRLKSYEMIFPYIVEQYERLRDV